VRGALALGEPQRVVRQEAVADQHPVVVLAQDLDDHLVAAAVANAVEGGVRVGEDPQPGRAAADLPPGLVDVLDVTCRAASASASELGRANRASR